ncbi:uncharacterized protein BX664DRAFT_362080 [Halteromyces radiatus]|uniref:uncharacterized protein n=1 Tax=Halteromyces radiatus TaxID=101107 RepID=UPI00221EE178|nr:uncharacterized protein BX664DRAFT_362080 [Halteromyces radiatus]KAI8079951.1 hypothetical protein BX664DRAFT_362080 [Halteromyces radiatus]
MPPNTETDTFLYQDDIASSSRDISEPITETIVIVGFGMTAVSFIEKILEYDNQSRYRIRVFSEEPTVAYNRVGLTQYFSHHDTSKQWMKPPTWYDENNVDIHLGDPVEEIDITNQAVRTRLSGWVQYDKCILATGSSAAIPPGTPINEMDGVFVYRTLEDLDNIHQWSQSPSVKHASIVGGGLLGLEAAKAAKDLGLQVTIYERSDRLLSRQLDQEASNQLEQEIISLGLKTCIGHCPVTLIKDQDEQQMEIDPNPSTKNNRLAGMILSNGEHVKTDMVIYSIGITPRDHLAQKDGHQLLERGDRGGFKVNSLMETSAGNIYAIGECASYNGMCYGLVAPCYDMADVVARNLTTRLHDPRKIQFKGADMSTKLKLLGVHVASFGDCFADTSNQDSYQPLIYRDPFARIYKKYIFTNDGKKLIGGMMVGDTKDYAKLLSIVKSGKRLLTPPSELILGVQNQEAQGADALTDDTQICSCNNVTKGDIRKVIKAKKCQNVNQVKCFSKAGSGCGGCLPQVQEIFESELKSLGQTISNSLCSHFKYSRAELFTIGKVKELHSFDDFVREASDNQTTLGCEVCKPAIASILASLWNEHILNPKLVPLQDTNDRYLANIQRGGLYSVVPRIAAGEVTPEKLGVIANVAKEYNLYTKITGAQRIDIMGAKKEDLPDIWEKLVDAGFESGHAYGKSLRAVKSCVGTTWCRYGQQDSVGFAIKLENRYKGIRSPHKLKGGVSGCIRECAEAQGKDFGCIATDKGYNVYVCGNGGSKPKHAELLIADASEEMVLRYLDRFLMYYIMTADRLMRTARWLEKLEGGIAYLRKVVIDDYLGIAQQLENHMHQLIGAYQCEWTTVVRDPKLRAHFKPFVNSQQDDEMIEMIEERGQRRPANWPKEVPLLPPLKNRKMEEQSMNEWICIGSTDLFPSDEGKVVLIGDVQIAIFHTQGRWYATQNMCPHKRALVLASGLLGTSSDNGASPYVSCPMHKKNFDLQSGECLVPGEKEKYRLETFDVKVEQDQVFLKLGIPLTELNQLLGSAKTIITKYMAPVVMSQQELSGCSSAGGGCGDKALEW